MKSMTNFTAEDSEIRDIVQCVEQRAKKSKGQRGTAEAKRAAAEVNSPASEIPLGISGKPTHG